MQNCIYSARWLELCMTTASDEALGLALRLIDTTWRLTEAGPWTQPEDARPIDRLSDMSEAATLARSARAQTLLGRFADVDAAALPRDLASTLGLARVTVARWAREGEWYWHVFDPARVGFFAMFAPTPYGGGFLLSSIRTSILAKHRFEEPGDLDRYLGLVSDYARMVRQFDARTRGQAERGIVMPAPQLDQAIPLIEGLAASAPSTFTVDAARLSQVAEADLPPRLAARIEAEVAPAFGRLLATLREPAYRAAAPEQVGLSQYPGGAEIYAELVKQHLTVDLTPEDVHAAGHARIARIGREMQALLDEVGFPGSPADYHAGIAADPAWRAKGEAAVGEVFRRYIDRITPQVDAYFSFKPSTGVGVRALPAAAASSMTFGYYEPPVTPEADGVYVFNAANLSNGPVHNIAALNYHELVPGHHMHIASQRENEALHPLRKAGFVNAFNEGWAEYAATLAGEMGMYREPQERFGRMVMDAFLTCRLVVDTGMNALGWSLEQARGYMRAHAFMPETEVRSESIRYSCDIPAQSLAYKMGDDYLMALRSRMQSALGQRFDIRDFHDAVLRPGALPLPLVKANVEAETARLVQA